MNQKQQVGIEAAKYIKNDMVVGLGTGSTAYYMIKELGRRIKEERLNIIGVPTSNQTKKLAQELHIPLKSIDEVSAIDITIDGADEISEKFHGIKGGGAALLFEKIVATYSKENIWIVDESKMVKTLGKFPLPVEVIPYGSQQLLHLFEKAGMNPTFRLKEDQSYLLTEAHHYIIDLQLDEINDPIALGKWLHELPGVVEHGIFANIVTKVIVGKKDGIQTIDLNKDK